MTDTLRLLDDATRNDLRVFLERLQRVGLPEVRLVARAGALGVFGCTQAPAGLTDAVPVVIVMRAFALAEPPGEAIDRTVEGRALLDRLARMAREDRSLALPDALVTAAWAGVLPPMSGWEAIGALDAASLVQVAQQGIARVASALPENPGEAVVRKVRAEVWGAQIAPGVPAAAAFAAEAMGFLRGEGRVLLARTRAWTRLSSGRGQVIVRHGFG